MSESLVDAIQQAIEMRESTLNTTIPGTIVSYDPATNLAVVLPSLPKRMANGTTLDPKPISNVPVVMPASGMIGGKQAALTFPIGPGDGVKLDFSQRSLEGWLSGKMGAPDDPRQFDLSDCIATPGLNHTGIVGNATDLVLRLGEASVTLKPDNTLSLGNAAGSITIGSDGTIIIKGNSVVVEAGGKTVVIETHAHTLTEPGLGQSGPPP